MKVKWDTGEFEEHPDNAEVMQEFYPNGCEQNPLCEAVFVYGPNWRAAQLDRGWYWWRSDKLGDLDALCGPFETYVNVLEDAGAAFADC